MVSLVAHTLSQIFLHPCSAGLISWLLTQPAMKSSGFISSLGSWSDITSCLRHCMLSFRDQSFQALGSDTCTLARVSPGSRTLLARPAAGFSVSMRQQYVGSLSGGEPGLSRMTQDLLTPLKKKAMRSSLLIYKCRMKDLLFFLCTGCCIQNEH